MNLQEVIEDVGLMLSQFRLIYRKQNLISNISSQFVVEDFGTIVCCINRVDYTQINDKLANDYNGWRRVFISDLDILSEKRYEVLWALMRGGYMTWLRRTYPHQIKSVLVGADNLGNRIIDERLRIWNDAPKYRFLIADNIEVKQSGVLGELTHDPGFFDYMPEE